MRQRVLLFASSYSWELAADSVTTTTAVITTARWLLSASRFLVVFHKKGGGYSAGAPVALVCGLPGSGRAPWMKSRHPLRTPPQMVPSEV